MKKTFVLTLAMDDCIWGAAVPAMAANTYTATPTGQTVTLNGRQVDFAAYNIRGQLLQAARFGGCIDRDRKKLQC